MAAAETALPPVPPAGIRERGYLPEVEALRGVAVLLVYVFHSDAFLSIPLAMDGLDRRAETLSPLRAYVSAGHTGVALFFVLSGFLLSLPFLAEADGGPRVSRRRYAERRALRILPLYWALLLVAAASTGEWLRAAPYLVFANGFMPLPTAIEPYTNVVWSLATEVQFYLLLPLLPLALRGTWGPALLVIYAITWLFWAVGWLQPFGMATTFRFSHSVFGRGWTFLAGIGVAWVYRQHGAALRARAASMPLLRHGGSDAILAAVLLALGGILLWTLRHKPNAIVLPPLMVWQLAEAAAWGAVLLLVLVAPLRVKPLFQNRGLITLGVLSYSIYLWHVPVLHAVLAVFPSAWRGWNGAGFGAFAVSSVLILAGSMVTYRLIEQPFLRRKTRLGL